MSLHHQTLLQQFDTTMWGLGLLQRARKFANQARHANIGTPDLFAEVCAHPEIATAIKDRFHLTSGNIVANVEKLDLPIVDESYRFHDRDDFSLTRYTDGAVKVLETAVASAQGRLVEAKAGVMDVFDALLTECDDDMMMLLRHLTLDPEQVKLAVHAKRGLLAAR